MQSFASFIAKVDDGVRSLLSPRLRGGLAVEKTDDHAIWRRGSNWARVELVENVSNRVAFITSGPEGVEERQRSGLLDDYSVLDFVQWICSALLAGDRL